MTRLAFVTSGAEVAAALLRRKGWRVVDMDRAPPEALDDRPGLLVGAVRDASAPDDLRRLAALHVLAPEIPMVVVAESLDDGQGRRLYETLLDVPIIRRGTEAAHLSATVASAATA